MVAMATVESVLCAVVGRGANALMTEDQLRRTESSRHQFFESNGSRRMSSRELGHEGDAAAIDAFLDLGRLVGTDFESDSAVDGFARFAGGQHGQMPNPVWTQGEHGFDVRSFDHGAKAIDWQGIKIFGDLIGLLRDFATDRANIESI